MGVRGGGNISDNASNDCTPRILDDKKCRAVASDLNLVPVPLGDIKVFERACAISAASALCTLFRSNLGL